jgi:hypothetical protein
MARAPRNTFVTLAAVALCALVAAPAHAYVRSRSPDGKYDLIWPDPHVTLTLRMGGAAVLPMNDYITAVMNAAATWSDPALNSSVVLTIATSSEPPVEPAFDHENTIQFRTTDWGPPNHTPGELALTTIWTQGGKIVDTDTEINGFDPAIRWALFPDDPAMAAAFAADVDLQNAITHELGHVIGLDHPCYLGGHPPDPPEVNNEGAPVPSCSDPALPTSVRDATMFPSAARGSFSERTLSPDEVLALHDLYPAGQAPVVEGPPMAAAGGCAVAGGRERGAPSSGGSALAGLVLAIPALLRARRRACLGR